MGQRADRVGHEDHETPGDEFAQGRGWNAGDEEDPTMRDEPGLAGLEDDIGMANRPHSGETLYEEADVVEVQSETRDDATDETDAIRSDIEDTRANMSSTIDAIQEKLSPQRLTEQAKDAVRDATVGKVQDMASNITEMARDTGSGLMDSIRENPLPAALVGIGVGWLFLSARRRAAERDRWRPAYGSGSGRSANSYPYDRYGQYGSSQYGSSQPSQQENGKMSQVADNVKDKLSDAGDRAQDMTDTVKEHASDMAEQAQWQAQRARGWLERTWDENPLVVAVAALAAGALVGLSIPETQVEREMMGEASGNVLQKAADTAQDVTQNVSEKAQQTMRDATPDASKQ
jgi:gas vesicle protein